MIYICGDSFSVPDPNAGLMWVDMIKSKLPVVNLAVPGASNYLIYLQVKHAIENGAEHIIYQATSSIRQEFAFAEDSKIKDSYCRYHNPVVSSNEYSMICGSWHNVGQHHSKVLSKEDNDNIANFSVRFFDIANAIEKNYIYILHTLNLISKANLKSWAWSRGGFEHKNFKDSTVWNFSHYDQHEVDVNLWDYYDNSVAQPVFHITNQGVHQTVCNQYIKMLQL